MTAKTQVRRFGGSLGLILPKPITDALALEAGDELFLRATPDGLTATPYDPEFAEAMVDLHAFMRKYRDAFRGLDE